MRGDSSARRCLSASRIDEDLLRRADTLSIERLKQLATAIGGLARDLHELCKFLSIKAEKTFLWL